MEILYRLKGNEPLLLDDILKVWVVQTGSVAIFATQVKDSTAVGERRYLFTVGEGEALFGAALFGEGESGDKGESGDLQQENSLVPLPEPTTNSLGLLAVALLETSISQISITELVELVAAGDEIAIKRVETWINHLNQTVGTHYPTADSGLTSPPNPSRIHDAALRPPSPQPPHPPNLGGRRGGTGVQSPPELGDLGGEKDREGRLGFSITPENAAELPNLLANIHTDFFNRLQQSILAETLAAKSRFEQLNSLNTQVVQDALINLVTAGYQELGLTTKLPQFNTPNPPQTTSNKQLLLIAAGAVGKAISIAIRPPTHSQDLFRDRNPVEAIARASQFRTRRVLLEDEWWLRENGPLLAYTKQEKQPVALLPAGSRYLLFDPLTQKRIPVTKTVAATLAPEAQMFYRPLPQEVNPMQLFLFSAKGYEKDIALIFVVGVIGTLLGMVVPWATGILIDHAIPDSDRTLLWQIALALFVLGCGRTAFSMCQGIISLRVSSAASSQLQPAIWDRLLKLSPAFFRQYTAGDLLSRTLTISQIRDKVSGATLRTLLSALFALLNLVLMFVYSWQLALVGMGMAILAAALTLVSGWIMLGKTREQLQLGGLMTGFTIQLINGVAKLRVALAEGRAFAAWSDRYSKVIKLEASIQRITDNISVFNEALSLATTTLIYWIAIVSIEMAQTTGGGNLTPGTFLAFNAAFGIFLGGVTSLSNTAIDILGIMPLWERAEPILLSQPEDDSKKASPGRLTGRVALEHVSFRYREDGPLVLDDITLHAEPGEFIAIVGPSGGGKSTLIRLLLGFETPTTGTLYYDGLDLKELELASVRRQLGVVLQNGKLTAGSIFENISGGALVSHQEAWEAAQMAGFAEDISSMPMQMHTVVSEGGTNLSGGQRQRLLIARSLVLKPRIILLDEATSSLDNRTQAIVVESLDKLNATRIVIAHRLSTIRHADRIYVIEAGRMMQVGTFEELVKQEGLFAQLVVRQME